MIRTLLVPDLGHVGGVFFSAALSAVRQRRAGNADGDADRGASGVERPAADARDHGTQA